MVSTQLVAGLQEALVGLAMGVVVALVGRLVLVRANLLWTWAVPPTMAGAVLIVVGGVFESWAFAIAAGGVLTAWWTFIDERQDRESGGDARRRVRGAVGPADVLAARRSRARAESGEVATDRDFLLGFSPRSTPLSLRYGGTSGRHGLLLRASGTGKSNALQWCIARHIDAGSGAVVIDMKGDQELARHLFYEAEAAEVDFYEWTLDGDYRWNPLARGNRSELKDKLIASEEFTERHYQSMYERYLLNLFRALEAQPAQRNLRTVIRLLDPAELAMFVRDIDENAAEDIGTYLSRLTKEQTRDLRGLADRLALLIEGNHGEWLLPSDDGNEMDLLSTIQEGSVAFFSLNSSSYGQTAKLIGNMVIQDLKAACGARHAPKRAYRRSSRSTSSPGSTATRVAGLFQRARSAGLSLMLATQELADLRRVDEGFDEQIVGNVEWVLAGRQNNPSSAETVAALAGTEEVWVHTFQTDDIALRGQGPFPRESGMGTKHRGREFIVSPDEIKAFGVGRMLLIEKNPHRVETVEVLPADHPVNRNQRAA